MKTFFYNNQSFFFNKLPFALSIILTFTVCSKRYPIEEENDPLVQLYVINFANEYYSNSCQHPSLALKKNELSKIELKLDEQKWFRFSTEGITPKPTAPGANYSFFIQKAANTEVSWITSSLCIKSPSYTYERSPITSPQTELKFNLWNSDFFSDTISSAAPSKNGYYIKLISGDPNIIIRFE